MLAPVNDEYLTTDKVCLLLASAGADSDLVGRVFAARLEPENLDDPERKYVLGVPLSESRAMLVVYRFGLGRPMVKNHPLDEGGPDWRPRWLSVEGPFTIEDVPEKAKELTQ